ncbi:MAG: hypothetical protein ABIR70_07025 [Bryobacteraceae bacterium]
MRIVTWNCHRGPFEKKSILLDSLRPDIAVLQECAQPKLPLPKTLWFGDNSRQGLSVQAFGSYEIRALPPRENVPSFFFPVEVRGPQSFNMLVAWAKADRGYRDVRGAIRSVEIYRDMFEEGPTLLIGDLNSNTIWDYKRPPGLNHSGLVNLLSSLGVTSAYHMFHNEEHGAETRPTFFMHRNSAKPYHIDYCFMPKSWVGQLASVKLGSNEEWKDYSDHRPLIVDYADVSEDGARAQ